VNFHRKEEQLKNLHRKAAFKNQDEFAYAMLSHKQIDGRTKKKATHLDESELRLLETQDSRYVGMREQIDRKATKPVLRQSTPMGESRRTMEGLAVCMTSCHHQIQRKTRPPLQKRGKLKQHQQGQSFRHPISHGSFSWMSMAFSWPLGVWK